MKAFLDLRRLLAGTEPLLLVIAGPNGAGKTTYFETCLEAQLRLPYVNADRIARGMDGSRGPADRVAFEAAALMRQQLLASRVSFCMETVFSDPVGDKLAFFRAAQASGYVVAMIFVGLASAELSARRVAQRVAQGGHDVPAGRLRERFPRVLANLRKALRFLDLVVVLDNSEVVDLYREVAIYRSGKATWVVEDPPSWLANRGRPRMR
ncbi:MAG: zeta toxin family protein [Usitatibacter sp.]